jgi:hypothetical protein
MEPQERLEVGRARQRGPAKRAFLLRVVAHDEATARQHVTSELRRAVVQDHDIGHVPAKRRSEARGQDQPGLEPRAPIGPVPMVQPHADVDIALDVGAPLTDTAE